MDLEMEENISEPTIIVSTESWVDLEPPGL